MGQVVFSELQTELSTDPRGLGYAGKTVEERYALLNTKTVAGFRPYQTRSLLVTLAKRGVWIKLKDAASDPLWVPVSNPSSIPVERIRSICDALTIMVLAKDVEDLDPNDSVISNWFDILVEVGIMTAAAAKAVKEEGGNRISRAEELWGVPATVTYNQLQRAAV